MRGGCPVVLGPEGAGADAAGTMAPVAAATAGIPRLLTSCSNRTSESIEAWLPSSGLQAKAVQLHW
jgi:hypothetical protein